MGRSGFCLALHGHIPNIINHGSWPHGENWLFEAIFEVYLPLLEWLESSEDVDFSISLGLTPILIHQLSSSQIKHRFSQ